MYPKLPPHKAALEKARRLQSAQTQREELRTLMSSKLQNKYLDKDPNLITSKVNQLINKERSLTANNLHRMEQEIKSSLPNQHQIEIKQKKGNEDEESVKSGFSKMSGASNFDKIDKLSTKRFKDVNRDKESEAKKKEILVLNEKPQINELGSLREENEWAAIMKYNKYLFQKEEKIKELKAKELQKKIKKDLDNQLKEKENIKEIEKKRTSAWDKNLNIQIKMAEEKEKEKIAEFKRKALYEKETRDKQMKENKAKKRFEEKQEKTLDHFLLKRLREELQAEKEFHHAQKEHQFNVMKKILESEEERKKINKIEKEKERIDNIRLQEAYYNLIEEQEKNKEENLRKRDQKAKEFMEQAIDLTSKEYMK